jgi:phosphatidate cytidylyltransferase
VEPSVAPPGERRLEKHPGVLTLRILSSLVLIPGALAAVWFGAPFLPALVALAGAGMGWEWARLARISSPVATLLIIAAPFLAAIAIAVDRDIAALLIAVLFAAGAALAAPRRAARLWSAIGTLWISLPCVAILALDRGAGGRARIFFLLAVVWASDIGAYASGRLIGGPKLAPRLSPNKTWAGAFGGLGCAMLTGFIAARLAGAPVPRVVAVSFVVALAAELGDLAESFAKRRFGAKDSSHLIPGHGGLLDRLDSLLAAAPTLALMLAATAPGGLGR